jgi:voltage-gated potassium channel
MDYSKLILSLMLFMGVIGLGTIGYTTVEHMPVYDALYMTIITISTVGFSEIRPLSAEGRALTIFLIVTGISLGTYTLGQLFRVFIEGELRLIMGRRKLKKDISTLHNHYIICGYGRIGRIVSQELAANDLRFVLIEMDASKAAELEKKGYLYLSLDATEEETLVRAGIRTAKAIVTAVRSDAHNVFITLTAKGLRPDIFVLSRVSDIRNENKLLRAGATRVVAPYQIGGRRMAQVLKSPTVVDFIDSAMMGSGLDLGMEEALVSPASPRAGKTLVESNIRRDFGVIIVAIKRPDGTMIFNPLPGEIIHAGDVAVVIGKKEELVRLRHELE